MLGVVAAQGDKLPADRTVSGVLVLLLAVLSVADATLHALTLLTATVRIRTLTGVHQVLDDALDAEATVLGRLVDRIV